MIDAISNSYLNTARTSYLSQRPAPAPVQNTKTSSVAAVQKSAGPEVPVQAVDAVKPVTSHATGNLEVALPVQRGADPAELAVRMRIHGDEEDATSMSSPLTETKEEEAVSLLPGQKEENGRVTEEEPSAIQEALEADKLEKEEKAEADKEAKQAEEAKETQKEAKAKREERLEALKEELKDEETPEEEEAAGQVVDRTASVLQGQQMQFLFEEHTRAQALGLKGSGYQVQMESGYQNGRIQFSANLSRDPAAVEQERQARYEQLSANMERRYPSFIAVA